MAINLPQGLYTAGAQPLDVSPSTNFANQLALKQQARQDALNEYYQSTNKDINPNGLRSQDTQAFMDKFNDFNDFYSKNRAAIQNPRLDNGQAQAEYNARHQDMLAYANTSKNTQAIHQQLQALKTNPATAYMFNTPDVIPAVQKMELPISDPNHQDIDIDQMKMNAAPVSIKKINDIRTGLLKSMGGDPSHPVGDPRPDGTGNAYQDKQYNAEEKAIGIAGANEYYANDPQIRASAEQIANDPNRYQAAMSAFTDATGKPAQTPADLYAGEQLAMIGADRIKAVKVTDTQAKSNITEGRQVRLSNLNYQHATSLKELANQLSYGKTAQEKQDDFTRIKQFGDDLADPAIAGKGMNTTDENGQPATEYKLNVPQSLYKTYKQPGADGEEPARFTVDRGKTYMRATYPDSTSKKVSWGGFLTDIGNAAPAARHSTPSPVPVPAVPGAGAKPTKSDQDLLNQYGIKIQ